METILEVGGEGGLLALQGQQADDGWVFTLVKDERAMLDMLPGEFTEDELYSESGELPTWNAALEALDRYPWARMFPMKIHPDFAERVIEAASERLGNKRVDHMDYWQRVLKR